MCKHSIINLLDMLVEVCQRLHQCQVVALGEVPLCCLDFGKQLPGQRGDVVDGGQGRGGAARLPAEVQQAGEKPGREIHLE